MKRVIHLAVVIFSLTVLFVIPVSTKALILLPSFDVVINEHSVGGDDTFDFRVTATQPPGVIPYFDTTVSIPTVSGEGSGSAGDFANPGNIFRVVQNPKEGWQTPSIICTSDNPSITFDYFDGGVDIVAEPFSFATCDFTNIKASSASSNVIFVPGFEGSRLYEQKKNNLVQRWEAGLLSLNDVKSLFLDNTGQSLKNIVTKDVIETTNYAGSFNRKIYQAISDWLNLQKGIDKINDFELFPYDWRLDIANLSLNGTKTNTEVLNLKNKIIELAQTSKTGKVTLIGHSNGGLLVKKTIQLLQQEGNDNLVDNVIFVGVPQLGTPSAVVSVLHGDDTRIAGGFILSAVSARQLLHNMPGVYGLLPFEKLYSKIGLLIHFSGGLNNNWDELYGTDIDAGEQRSFLTGGDGRHQPKDTDLANPAVLNPVLYDTAQLLHNSLDNFVFPAHINLYEIAGVGVPTISGITYKDTFFGQISHRPDFSCDGDKTVLSASAVDYGVHTDYLDMSAYEQDTGEHSIHFNMMENPEIISTIENIVTGSSAVTPHISAIKPSLASCSFKLIGTHSPVDLDVYDAQGRHVGIDDSHSTDVAIAIDTSIPGSDFIMIGDEKYALVPDAGVYTVHVDGTGTGLFTLDVASYTGGQVADYQAYANLPVSTELKATLTLDIQSTALPYLQIDVDGDGTIDQEVAPGEGTGPIAYLLAIRSTILDLHLSSKLEKSLIAKIDKTIIKIKKGKFEKVTLRMQKLLNRLENGKKINKEMSPSEKQGIIDSINEIIDSL